MFLRILVKSFIKEVFIVFLLQTAFVS